MWFDKRLPILSRVVSKVKSKHSHVNMRTMSDQTAVALFLSRSSLVPLKVWCLKSAKQPVVVPIKVAISCFKLTLYYMKTRETFWDWHQTYCWMDLHLDPKSQAVKLPEHLPSKIAPDPRCREALTYWSLGNGLPLFAWLRWWPQAFWRHFLIFDSQNGPCHAWNLKGATMQVFLLWMSNTLF